MLTSDVKAKPDEAKNQRQDGIRTHDQEVSNTILPRAQPTELPKRIFVTTTAFWPSIPSPIAQSHSYITQLTRSPGIMTGSLES